MFLLFKRSEYSNQFKIEGRELANQQLMDAMPRKETLDVVLMNLVKGLDGR